MKRHIILAALLGSLILGACDKDFLDVKPSSDTVVPRTLQDFQQLLDNADLIFAYPDMLDLLADDYYLETTYWQSISPVYRNAHVWADDIYGATENDFSCWERPYQQILYANVVLEGLANIAITPENQQEYQRIQGNAYFVRAWALHILAQLYAPAYDEDTADTDLGVPIPVSSDINEKMVRGTVRETYAQIVGDLLEAGKLLDNPVEYSGASAASNYALLARVYLSMREYQKAGEAAGKSLAIHNKLIDMNTETFDYRKSLYFGFEWYGLLIRDNNQNIQIVDELYGLYEQGDLRRNFYRLNNQGKPYRLSIIGWSSYYFRGLDTDEQYLILAESQAYAGRISEAINTLNHLLRHRYRSGTFVYRTASSKEEALSIVREERRKELVFRGVRWSDLKRFNKEGANITLQRKLGENVYTLSPNSPKWLFPIPTNEIKTSGIQQNPR